ncbi:MAG: DUF6745 domain-containing protein [Heteroscytonema crispum UTEX LB 1556]
MFGELEKQVRYDLLYPLEQIVNLGQINQLEYQLVSELERKLHVQPCNFFDDGSARLDILPPFYSFFEFCISVFKCHCNQERWEILQKLCKHCGRIFTYEENICIVCDRPLHIRFDNENRLHAEGKPAIQFADGYSLYFYHGVTLPEKYGIIHPQQWQAQWLLTEDNAELRRVLIQGIGYAKICQELQATELDSWAEYTLLKIDNYFDDELIYLLKMTCPSTGFIHALRVPPTMKTAREAIVWVNWGIYLEEFAVQT